MSAVHAQAANLPPVRLRQARLRALHEIAGPDAIGDLG